MDGVICHDMEGYFMVFHYWHMEISYVACVVVVMVYGPMRSWDDQVLVGN
jgi:hypothetical protein